MIKVIQDLGIGCILFKLMGTFTSSIMIQPQIISKAETHENNSSTISKTENLIQECSPWHRILMQSQHKNAQPPQETGFPDYQQMETWPWTPFTGKSELQIEKSCLSSQLDQMLKCQLLERESEKQTKQNQNKELLDAPRL